MDPCKDYILKIYGHTQWRNGRGGGAGWQSVPQILLTGKFLLTYREKRGKEKREIGAEKKENRKKEGGKLKMEGGKVTKWGDEMYMSLQ